MTLSLTGYTVGANQALTRARILYAPITGTVTATGTNGSLATNDYPAQRWTPAAGSSNWTIQTAANASVDCCFIAAHNLAGKTVLIQTATAVGGPYTTRATIVPADNSTICALFNTTAGNPYTIREMRINVSDGTGVTVGIIRFGVALQMSQSIMGGHAPLQLNRATETRQSLSETGNWLGRTQQARRLQTS